MRGSLGQPLGDLDDLPFGQRQPPHFLVGAQRREIVFVEQRQRLAAHLGAIDGAQKRPWLMAEPDVLLDAEIGDQRQFLEDGGDAARLRRIRIGRAIVLAIDQDRCRHHAAPRPTRIWMKVLFPAPFSPSSACTSPARALNVASLSATMPP